MVTTERPPILWEIVAEPGTAPDLRQYFHPGQWRAWMSEKRFIFMLAGTQSGKTSFGPHWLCREIIRRGSGDYLGVTSSFPLLKLKMEPEFLSLFRDTLHLGIWFKVDRVFEISREGGEYLYGRPELSRVIFGSATNPNSLESATAKGAWLDEAGQDDFRVDSWEAVIRRLSLYLGRLLAGTTVYNLGWLKQLIYDPWLAGERPDVDIIQFPSTLNPIFPIEEYERARSTMPDWKFRMFYGGQYGKPAGLIYADFDDRYREQGGHKVRPFTIPPEWPRYGGLDFGGVHTARLLAAHDPAANVYYLYDELMDGGKTSAQHAAAALAAVVGTNMQTWHGGSKSEDQQRMDWTAAGVPVQEPVVSDVEAGIDRVIALFKTRRLYVFDTCRGLLDELGTYSRVLDELNQPTEEIKDKRLFHRLDALRYLVQGLEQPPPAAASIPRESAFSRPSVRIFRR